MLAGMPTAKRVSDCSGASASRSTAPSTMMRNSGSPALEASRAELGGAAADEPGDRRRDFGAPDAHLEFLTFGVAGLAVGFGDAERVIGRGELSLSRLQRRLALLDGRNGHHAARKLLGALEVVARPFHLHTRLGDVALRLLDRGVGAS